MTTDADAWSKLVGAHSQLSEALLALRSESGLDRIRRELVQGERVVALFLLPFLSEEDVEELLPELVYLASFSHGSIGHVRSTIRRLPKDSLKRLLPKLSEKHLQGSEEYRRFLELFAEIDEELCAVLAERASASDDDEVREVGIEFRRG